MHSLYVRVVYLLYAYVSLHTKGLALEFGVGPVKIPAVVPNYLLQLARGDSV